MIRRFAPVTIKLDKSWFSPDRLPERLAYEIDTLPLSNIRLIAEGADLLTAITLKRQLLPQTAQMLVQGFEHHQPQATHLVAARLAVDPTQRRTMIAYIRAALRQTDQSSCA